MHKCHTSIPRYILLFLNYSLSVSLCLSKYGDLKKSLNEGVSYLYLYAEGGAVWCSLGRARLNWGGRFSLVATFTSLVSSSLPLSKDLSLFL